jgi:hypothetical protein
MRDETLQDQEYDAAEGEAEPEGAVPTEAEPEVEGVDDLFDFGSQESAEADEVALEAQPGDLFAEVEAPDEALEENVDGDEDYDAAAEETAPAPRARAQSQQSGLPTWMIAAATALLVVNLGIGGALAVRAIRRARKPPAEIPTIAEQPEVANPNETPAEPEPVAKAPVERPPVHIAPPKPRFPSIVSAASFAADDHPLLASAEKLFAADKFSSARKRYFEVLLAPNPHFDGQDSALARLRIAQCLAREAAPPTAPVRMRGEDATPPKEEANK